jgi:hypothetical protein
MVENYILEDFDVCQDCDIVDPSRLYNRGEDDGCPMEEDERCPKEVLWFKRAEVADAIMNLECVKANPILEAYLNTPQ